MAAAREEPWDIALFREVDFVTTADKDDCGVDTIAGCAFAQDNSFTHGNSFATYFDLAAACSDDFLSFCNGNDELWFVPTVDNDCCGAVIDGSAFARDDSLDVVAALDFSLLVIAGSWTGLSSTNIESASNDDFTAAGNEETLVFSELTPDKDDFCEAVNIDDFFALDDSLT